MNLTRFAIVAALAAILAAPLVVRKWFGRAQAEAVDRDSPALIVITPHVEQIRSEFGIAFAKWHERKYHQPVRVDWRTPGGTTEIRKQLENQVRAAAERGRPGTDFDIAAPRKLNAPDRDNADLPELILRPGSVEADVFLGGGSFEHTQVKGGMVLDLTNSGQKQKVRCRVTSQPRSMEGLALFDKAWLDEVYGENKVGIEFLYEPDQYWFGTALSGFGIVYNRDVLAELGLPEPTGFADLGDPRYIGMVAMADARQSGSVATLYDSILNKEGWDKGWRILREMCASARYFATSSTTPPTDVSQGEAAAGVSIDFYGRGQAQAILRPGEDPARGRVGYIDPAGATYIDADPVSIINGARSPELARRFVEFCLSDEAQALWQFAPKTDSGSAHNPIGEDGQPMGPARERLRRMPAKRGFYRYAEFFTDKTNPFDIAMNVKRRGWRDALGPMMGAFGVDTGEELREAWKALNAARTDKHLAPARLEEMERTFYAMPQHVITGKDGKDQTLEFNEANYKAISDDTGRWRDAVKGARAKIAYTKFFKANYERVVELGRAPPVND